MLLRPHVVAAKRRRGTSDTDRGVDGSGGAVSSGRCPPRDVSGIRRLDPEDAAAAARGGGEEAPRDE